MNESAIRVHTFHGPERFVAARSLLPAVGLLAMVAAMLIPVFVAVSISILRDLPEMIRAVRRGKVATRADLMPGLVLAALLCQGCATGLVNQHYLDQERKEASAIAMRFGADSDGASEAMIGVDLTRLGQVAENPWPHALAAIADGVMAYYGYQWIDDSFSSDSSTPREPTQPTIKATGPGTTVTVQDAADVPFYIDASDGAQVTVDRYAGE